MNQLGILRPFSIDLFCLGKKFLVYHMVGRNLKVKYRRSFFGFFWTLLVPLATAGVYYFTFQLILKIEIPNYLVFILSGVLPWTFFSQTVTEGMESIVGNQSLISKVPVPVQIFPYVGSITNFVTLLLSFPILITAALISGVPIGPSLLLLIYYMCLLFLLAYGFSLLLAVSFVYLRDLRHIIGVGMQLWFYATPVIYHEDMIPEPYRAVLWFNPLGSIFTGFHDILLYGRWPEMIGIANATGWTLLVLIIAVQVQKSIGRTIPEEL